jgi:hypothetical protein
VTPLRLTCWRRACSRMCAPEVENCSTCVRVLHQYSHCSITARRADTADAQTPAVDWKRLRILKWFDLILFQRILCRDLPEKVGRIFCIVQ